MMYKNRCKLVGLLIVFFSGSALAAGISAPPRFSHGLYVSLFGGANWVTSGKTRTIRIGSGSFDVNRYIANKDSAVSSLVGLDIGYRWNLASRYLHWVTLGLETSYMRVISQKGLVVPSLLTDPNPSTLDYTYAVSSIPLFAVSQIGWQIGKRIEPYVIGGIGVSWNKASNYHEDPLSAQATTNSIFRSKTLSSFAYTVGAGVAFQVSSSSSIGLEYRYTNYGKASLGTNGLKGFPTSGSQKLSLGNIHSNALLLRFTEVFG